MPLFHDARPSEDHPDRPDHEDFRLMADVVQGLDAQAELGVPITELIGVDEPSLKYLGEQRIMRALGPGILSSPLSVIIEALYWDAFTIGASFNHRRTSGNETGTAGEGGKS